MKRSPAFAISFFLPLILAGCAGPGDSGEAESAAIGSDPVALPEGAQAISFLGDTLRVPEIGAAAREVYLARYQEAEDALTRAPKDADSLIWMGRRTAYLGQYREAIDSYTHALTIHPDEARLYRHRGHRYLTVRELDNAIADFDRAVVLIDGHPDEVEPDGLPNRLNTPTGTLHFNILYHLGLAHYLKGDLEAALGVYRSCMAVSVHADSVVATAYWLYMTLRRLGRDAEAAEVLAGIDADMEIIESTAYLDLLLLFKGERTVEDLVGPPEGEGTVESTTTAYGVGVYYLLRGDTVAASTIWQRVLSAADQWAVFGYIASEAEVARMNTGDAG